jgi:ectoine hydroxylase-related dioxygenase (phytanoyl-CoA dioxygenase family)
MVHNHIWHRTRQNRTQVPRRAISVSFLGADTHCIRRRREPREFKRLFADE